MRTYLITVLTVLALTQPAVAQEEGEMSVSITPSFAWFTEEQPHGNFRISNTGTRLAEVTVESAFGVIESPEDGTQAGIVVGEDHPPMRNLTEHLSIFPPRMIIPPGETRTVRYAVARAELLPPGGYVSLVSYRLSQRAAVAQGQVPVSSAGVQIEYSLVAPLVFIQGEGQPVIRVESLSLEDETLSLLLHNDGTFPWTGLVQVGSVDRTEIYGEAVTSVFTRRRADITVTGTVADSLRVMFMQDDESVPRSIRARLQKPEDVIIVR